MSTCSPKSHRTHLRVSGMTHAEVIASVSCVVAIFALLMPALAGARGQSKATQCLANLSRLGAASAVYAVTDTHEFSIPVHALFGTVPGALGEYEWGGKSGTGGPTNGGDPLSSRWGTQEGRGPATRRLNQVLYGDVLPDHTEDPGPNGAHWLSDTRLTLDLFRCPSDSGYSGHHYEAWRDSQLSSFDYYGNSYSATTVWIGRAGGNCRLQSNSAFLRPVSRVPNARQTILFLENCGRFAYRINYGGPNDGGCSSLSGSLGADVERVVNGWHGRPWVFQAAFVDGHAGEVTTRGHQQPEPRLGRYPAGGCCTGTPGCHACWHCAIFRGPGWQLDTLPAPPVLTDFPCASSGGVVTPIG